MKTIYAAFFLGLSFSALAHKDWEKSVFDAGIEQVRVVGIKSGDVATVRTTRACVSGHDCIDGMHQFDVRLPHVAAPTGRQPIARASYLSLRDLLLYQDVLFVPFSEKGDVVIGDFVVCRMSIGFMIRLQSPCSPPMLRGTDVVKNENGLIHLYRNGDRFYHSTEVEKVEHPEIEAYYQENPLNNIETSEFERKQFLSRMKRRVTARVTMAFASLSQSYAGMVYVDPKYTSFDSILYTAQDQAEILKKGIWSLPESQQVPPWEQ